MHSEILGLALARLRLNQLRESDVFEDLNDLEALSAAESTYSTIIAARYPQEDPYDAFCRRREKLFQSASLVRDFVKRWKSQLKKIEKSLEDVDGDRLRSTSESLSKIALEIANFTSEENPPEVEQIDDLVFIKESGATSSSNSSDIDGLVDAVSFLRKTGETYDALKKRIDEDLSVARQLIQHREAHASLLAEARTLIENGKIEEAYKLLGSADHRITDTGVTDLYHQLADVIALPKQYGEKLAALRLRAPKNRIAHLRPWQVYQTRKAVDLTSEQTGRLVREVDQSLSQLNVVGSVATQLEKIKTEAREFGRSLEQFRRRNRWFYAVIGLEFFAIAVLAVVGERMINLWEKRQMVRIHQTWLSTAETRFTAGEFETAADAFEESLKSIPDDATAIRRKGDALYALKRYTEAIREYSRALSISATDFDSFLWRGYSKYALNDKSGAVLDWEQAVKIRPNAKEPSELLSRIHRLDDLIKRANAGDINAQKVLAYDLATGTEVDKNPVEAAKWYKKLAESGDVESQSYYSTILIKGIGVSVDRSEGATWARKAAQKGNADAQVSIGVLLIGGDGIAKDTAEGYAWLAEATAHPSELEADVLDLAKKMMALEEMLLSKEQRASAANKVKEELRAGSPETKKSKS